MTIKVVNFLSPTQIEGLGPRYRRHPGPYAIEDIDLNRIFPGIEDTRIEPYIGEHVKGDADPPNLRLLTRLVKHLEPQHILEVGTFRGKTTYNLALHAPGGATTITIDWPREMIPEYKMPGYGTDIVYLQPKEQIGRVFREAELEQTVLQIFADSRSQECQRYLDELLEGLPIDFAFIDAAHDYESVRDNFEQLVLPRMTQDGVVVFDDYTRPLTHVGISHYLTRKAHDDGYVFYWYAPQNEQTNCVIFVNKPEAKDRNWREAK